MSGTQEYGCVVESRDKAAERAKDCTERHDDSDELLKPGQRQRTADLDMPSIPEPEALEVGT